MAPFTSCFSMYRNRSVASAMLPGPQPASRLFVVFVVALFLYQIANGIPECWCREGGSNPHEVALGGF